jgi:hypothetical protein
MKGKGCIPNLTALVLFLSFVFCIFGLPQETFAETTTVGDGTSPANKFAGPSATNNAVSAFTLSTDTGTDTVTQIVVTGINTDNVAASGVKIYQDNGSTSNEWDSGDTLITNGTASFSGATATFSSLSIPVTTTSTQYIITYNIVASPTNGQTLTGVVTGITCTNTVINNDSTDATITIDAAAPITTATPFGYTFGTWTATSPVSITLSADDGTGSGIASGYPKYCVDTTDTCSPATSYTVAFDVTCASGSTCTQYVRYQSVDNVGNTETVKSSQVKQDLQVPTSGASFSATPGDTQCSLIWTAASDGGSGLHSTGPYEVRKQQGSDPGSCSGGSQLYIGTGLSTTDTGLTNGQTYYYRLCYKDNVNNQSQYTSNPITCTPNVTTVGDGTNPANASLCPGGAATMLDSFTLQTSSGTDSVTNVTVTLTPTGAFNSIGLIEITTDSGDDVYGFVTNPAADAVTITTTGLSATTALTQYKVRITPKTHPIMPLPPGASYDVTGRVTAITSTYAKTYSDMTSATVTIDNASPSNATWGTITFGDQQITLNWTNPVDTDFNKVLILRKTSSISDTPVEGTIYAASGTIGTSVVVYVGNGTTFTDTGLTNRTTYYYKIFAYDTCINYATGAQTGPHIPSGAPTLTYPASPYNDGKDPDTGDTTTDFTFKVIYTDAENDPPAADYPKIYIGDNDGYASYTMSLDTSADASLKDGNYTNGEQYVYGPIGLGAAQDLRFYFEAQASTGDTFIVWLPSDAPTSFNTGPAVYLLDDYNIVGVPKDLGTGLSYSSVLGDDSGYLFCYTWNSAGLDISFDITFLGDWIDCTSADVQTGRGYYIWATASNYWRLDELSGTGNVTAANFDIDLDPHGGWNMISNPYNSIVQLPNVKVVKSSTEYTFSQAVTNGWIGNSIYAYEGPTTGYTFSAYNDTPPATLKPWVGYFIYVYDNTTSLTLRVYKPVP